MEVYLNGTNIQSLSGYVQNYENIFLSQSAASLLNSSGANVLAIHCHQTAGGQYVDAGLLIPAVPASLKNNGRGLTASYFNGINLNNFALKRIDTSVVFDWGFSSPDTRVAIDSFSARWTGFIQPASSGTYTFYINSDNGRRLTIDGQQIINAWVNDWNKEYSGTIDLTGGQKYPITLDYFEMSGGASITFDWSSNSVARQHVPSVNLYPDFSSDANIIVNQYPIVSITAPATNAVFTTPVNITINATANDADGTVAKVDFYNGSQLLYSDNAAPYSYVWTNAPAGEYSISAKATDNYGATTVSSFVTMKINNPIPPSNADIIGPDCGSNGTSATFSLNTSDRTGATSYSWWYTGSAPGVAAVAGQPYNAILNYGNSFSAGQVCVGVNYSVSPWYKQFCKNITVCGSSARLGSAEDLTETSGASLSPNPSQAYFTLSLSKPADRILIVDSKGTEVSTMNNREGMILFGDDLNTGLFTVLIQYSDGTIETRRVEKIK